MWCNAGDDDGHADDDDDDDDDDDNDDNDDDDVGNDRCNRSSVQWCWYALSCVYRLCCLGVINNHNMVAVYVLLWCETKALPGMSVALITSPNGSMNRRLRADKYGNHAENNMYVRTQ